MNLPPIVGKALQAENECLRKTQDRGLSMGVSKKFLIKTKIDHGHLE